MLTVLLPKLLVSVTRDEVSVKFLAVLDPLGAQYFEVICLVGIILHKVTDSSGLNIVCVVLRLEVLVMED